MAIKVLRSVIDSIDETILNALKDRKRISHELQDYKRVNGLTQTDIGREREILNHYWDIGRHGVRIADQILFYCKED